MTSIATNIDTVLWNSILDYYMNNGWKIINEYPKIFDKGIDEDFYTLKKKSKKIKFGWTNMGEGEIKCDNKILMDIKLKFDISLNF